MADVLDLRNQTVAASLREASSLRPPGYSAATERGAVQNLSQKWRGATDTIFRHLFRRSAGDHLAAGFTRFRPQIEDVVGFGDHTEIVFDDNDGVSFVNEPMQHVEEQFNVCHVQADRRFLKQIQCRSGLAHFSDPLVRSATDTAFQLRHQLEPLRFAAA